MTWDGPNRRNASDFDERIISKAEMRECFREEAESVVKNVFGKFGVDVANQDECNRLRDKLVWVGEVQAASADAVKTARRAAITIAAGGILASLWIGFKDKLGL